jgi:hypothetical protein
LILGGHSEGELHVLSAERQLSHSTMMGGGIVNFFEVHKVLSCTGQTLQVDALQYYLGDISLAG